MRDLEIPARQLLRAIRGRRSQIAFCRRLGYTSNVATDWEAGRRFPTAEETLRACGVSGIDVVEAQRRFHAASADAYREGGVAAWLRALQGSNPQTEVARACGASRHQVGRWLRGDATPRLPELLGLLDALTGRMPEWVASLVDGDLVPFVRDAANARRRAGRLMFDVPWSPAVITLLATTRSAEAGAIARRLGLEPAALEAALEALVEAGLVARDGDRLRLVSPLTSSAEGSPEDRHRLRLHWAEVSRRRLMSPSPSDRFGLDVLAVSRTDLGRIRERYQAFYREIRALVAASEPAETAGLLVVHLFEWGGLDDPEPG